MSSIQSVLVSSWRAVASRLRERAQGRNGPSLALAYDLAATWGVSIEAGLLPDTWWVTCPRFSGLHDPLDGFNLQCDGVGVLSAVETYIEALKRAKG